MDHMVLCAFFAYFVLMKQDKIKLDKTEKNVTNALLSISKFLQTYRLFHLSNLVTQFQFLRFPQLYYNESKIRFNVSIFNSHCLAVNIKSLNTLGVSYRPPFKFPGRTTVINNFQFVPHGNRTVI